MKFETIVDGLNKKTIIETSDISYLKEFFTLPNKGSTDIGVVYITPFQVMQAFGKNMNHDKITQRIESAILDGIGKSRIYLRCYTLIDIKTGKIVDAFGWDFDLMHLDNKFIVKDITRDMYNLALMVQNYLVKLLKSNNREFDKDLCVFLDDIVRKKKIKIVNDKLHYPKETLYGYSLSQYSQKIKHELEIISNEKER